MVMGHQEDCKENLSDNFDNLDMIGVVVDTIKSILRWHIILIGLLILLDCYLLYDFVIVTSFPIITSF